MRTVKLILIVSAMLSFTYESKAQCNIGEILTTNGGFETGDFTDWVTTDVTIPFVALQVFCGTVNPGFGFDTVTPLEGSCMAYNGFDGNGPGDLYTNWVCESIQSNQENSPRGW